MEISVERYHYPIGQGTFSAQIIGADEEKYVCVYDCGSTNGSWNIPKYADDLLCKTEGIINLLVISHFDQDHVNGVKKLYEKKFKIKKIIIPYVTISERILFLLQGSQKNNLKKAANPKEFLTYAFDSLFREWDIPGSIELDSETSVEFSTPDTSTEIMGVGNLQRGVWEFIHFSIYSDMENNPKNIYANEFKYRLLKLFVGDLLYGSLPQNVQIEPFVEESLTSLLDKDIIAKYLNCRGSETAAKELKKIFEKDEILRIFIKGKSLDCKSKLCSRENLSGEYFIKMHLRSKNYTGKDVVQVMVGCNYVEFKSSNSSIINGLIETLKQERGKNSDLNKLITFVQDGDMVRVGFRDREIEKHDLPTCILGDRFISERHADIRSSYVNVSKYLRDEHGQKKLDVNSSSVILYSGPLGIYSGAKFLNVCRHVEGKKCMCHSGCNGGILNCIKNRKGCLFNCSQNGGQDFIFYDCRRIVNTSEAVISVDCCMGWLGTGDANLEDRDNCYELKRKIGIERLSQVGEVVVPHHGSASSSGDIFFDMLNNRANIVCIIHSEFKSHGHPHKEIIDSLNRKKGSLIPVHVTSDCSTLYSSFWGVWPLLV